MYHRDGLGLMALRTTLLAVMGLTAALGLWAIPAAILCGLVVDRGVAWATHRGALAWIRIAPLVRIERSPANTAWTEAIDAFRSRRLRSGGPVAAMRRVGRKIFVATHEISMWAPFAFFGLAGTALTGQGLIATLIILTYPCLGLSLWVEAQRDRRRSPSGNRRSDGRAT